MQGVIIYIDKKGEEKTHFFSGMKYGESPADFLKSMGIEFNNIKEFWDEG